MVGILFLVLLRFWDRGANWISLAGFVHVWGATDLGGGGMTIHFFLYKKTSYKKPGRTSLNIKKSSKKQARLKYRNAQEIRNFSG